MKHPDQAQALMSTEAQGKNGGSGCGSIPSVLARRRRVKHQEEQQQGKTFGKERMIKNKSSKKIMLQLPKHAKINYQRVWSSYEH